MKTKRFCISKEIVHPAKKRPRKLEKILSSYASERGMIYVIHKELNKLNIEKIRDIIKNWSPDLNTVLKRRNTNNKKHFSKVF